jgi:hypothetical protein
MLAPNLKQVSNRNLNQEVGQVAPPPGGAGQGLATPPYGVAGPWLPSVSSLDSVSCREKYELWLLFRPIPRIFPV